VRVIDDYGHHPTEIRATLAAARGLGGRVLVLFQPHRYSRTAALETEFGRAFGHADHAWVLDIYAAGETPMPGVSSAAMVDKAVRAGARQLEYAADPAAAAAAVAREARSGDVVITLGAGDVWKLGDRILEHLRGTEVRQSTEAQGRRSEAR
jgi:UDP-N-acetylmuramate--alanine ligase